MIKVSANGIVYECSKAVKGPDYITLYDAIPINSPDYDPDDAPATNVVTEPSNAYFSGISDFSGYVLIEGEWSSPEPTEIEILKAQLELTEEALDTLIMGGV